MALLDLQWFGPEAWSLHARTHPELRVDIPVGARCVYCDEPIGAGDSGVVMTPAASAEVYEDPADGVAGSHHEECFLRPIIGGVLHQLGQCTCGNARDRTHGPPGFAEHVVATMTKREEAVMAHALFREGKEHWTPREWLKLAEKVERGEHSP